MPALVLANINVYTKFEMPAFILSKDMIDVIGHTFLNKNASHDPDHANFSGDLSSQG